MLSMLGACGSCPLPPLPPFFAFLMLLRCRTLPPISSSCCVLSRYVVIHAFSIAWRAGASGFNILSQMMAALAVVASFPQASITVSTKVKAAAAEADGKEAITSA